MEVSSSGISFSGLFSGLDTENIIEQLIKIERLPINQLTNKKTRLDYEKQNLLEVNNSLLSLKGTLPTLAAGVTTNMTAASSNESILTASANAAAVEGSYDVIVKQLATRHITGSDWKDPATWSFAGGPENLQIDMPGIAGGLTFDQDSGGSPISIANGYSLTSIAQKINALWDSTGTYQFSDYAKAYIVTSELDPDGGGPAVAGSKVLVIESLQTGENYGFDFAGTPANLAALFQENNRGSQNSKIEIAGVETIQSSNQITTAIPGVTFDLLIYDPAEPTVKVTVGVDDDAIVASVKDFIDKFNASTDLMAQYITEDSVDDPETVAEMVAGILRGDYDLVSLKSGIRTRTTGYYLNDATAAYKILADIGISSQASSGSVVGDNIELDEDALRVALSTDREAVSELLQQWADDLEGYVDSQTKVSMIKEYSGSLYGRVLGIDDRMDAIDEDIEQWEDRVSAEEERLRASFTLMEQMLAQLQTQSTYLSAQLQNITNSGSGGKK